LSKHNKIWAKQNEIWAKHPFSWSRITFTQHSNMSNNVLANNNVSKSSIHKVNPSRLLSQHEPFFPYLFIKGVLTDWPSNRPNNWPMNWSIFLFYEMANWTCSRC
jgi:hypothetical protein